MTLVNSHNKALFLLLFLTFIIYYPGLYGSFILDDKTSIVDENAIKIHSITYDTLKEAANSGVTGPFKRPIAVISFAFNYYFSELDPFYFKLVNVIIHLFSALCVYILGSLLASKLLDLNSKRRKEISPQSIALLCTALWLLHPLNVSSVLYVVQRMNELAALFTFLSLISYCLFRERLFSSQKIWIAYLLIYLFLACLAVLSKENALLITSFALLIEITVYRFKSQSNEQKWILYALHTLFFALPVILFFLVYFDIHTLQNSYLGRSFTLSERIYSEFNIIIFYLKQILLPNIMAQSIFHDAWPITKSLMDSGKTMLSMSIIISLILSSLFLYKKKPAFSFGILWFFIGHSLESTIFPLELVFEHRNYVPMFGLLFIIAFYTQDYLLSRKRILGISIISIYLIYFSASTLTRTIEWGDSAAHIVSEQQRHPKSYRANLQLGNLYKKAAILNQNSKNQPFFFRQSLKHYQIATNLSNDYTIAYLGSILLHAQLKKEIPSSLINKYSLALSKNRIHISTALSFLELNACYSQSECQINSAQVEKLFSSVLSNKGISKANTAIVSAYYGDYFQIKGNLEKSLQLLQLAHINDPEELLYKERLIDILIIMKNFEQAKAIIKTIKQKDMTQSIIDIKNALNKI